MFFGLPAFLIKFAVFLIFLITGAGFLAEFFPFLDMVNHFRPFLLGGAAFLFIICAVMKYGRWRQAAAAVIFVNFVAGAVSFWNGGSFGSGAAIASHAAESYRSIISINVLYHNDDLDRIERFLKNEQADIVVFQEFSWRHIALLERLKGLYPYQKHCRLPPYCHLAILSRRPWRSITSHAKSPIQPPMISAEFGTIDGARFRVINTHIAWPFASAKQQRDLKTLGAYVRQSDIPVIIAGDFNHTPWSWRLTRFVFETGMNRHGTFATSWPAKIPVFLIDHVFSSPDVLVHETRTGPFLSSDHLPIISKFSVSKRMAKAANSLPGN